MNTEALFRSHASFVARMLGRLGVASDELDDAVQEVFLVVHRNGGYLPGPATPVGYLASIAVRVAASRRRRGRKSRERTSTVAPDDVSSSAFDPARSCEARQELAVVQDALDRLDPDLRTTLVLAELEGESCKDIAAMMRIPVGTVYWRLHRARKTFRMALGAAAPGDAAGETILNEAAANDTLGRARVQPLVVFDVVAGLARLRTAMPLAAKAPLWALMMARGAGWMGSVGIASPAVLSVVATVSLLPGAPGAVPLRPETGTAGPRHMLASLVVPPAMARPAMGPAMVLEVESPDVEAPSSVEVPAMAAAVRQVTSFAPVRGVVARAAPAPAGGPAAADGVVPTRPETDDGLQEIQGVAAAEHVLGTDPARALALVRQGDVRFGRGYLSEERHYIATLALFALGRGPEGRAEAASFLHDYPDGPFTARVRAAAEHAQAGAVVSAALARTVR